MDLLIDSAAEIAMFSLMDGLSRYNQIKMAPKDAEKTAFRTPMGNFYYTVMPFGLKNTGATYRQAMTAIFHNMMHQELEDYVDDIVIKSKKRKEHFYVLKKYDLRMGTPRAVKSQTIADLLAQFLGEEEFPLDDEVLGEVVMVEEVRKQWVMKFDGSSTTQLGGVRVVLYHEEDKPVVLLFKLEFPCSNNTAKYEAYLTGLATALEMGIKHLRVLGDSNLVVC
nr:uncharacterized protein LOC112015517 [Quercus suber]